jgi:hypothetical protein
MSDGVNYWVDGDTFETAAAPFEVTHLHACHALGCDTEVPEAVFMCYRHWKMLPRSARTKLWTLYRPGQEIDKTPSRAYQEHAMACVQHVADMENRACGR